MRHRVYLLAQKMLQLLSRITGKPIAAQHIVHRVAYNTFFQLRSGELSVKKLLPLFHNKKQRELMELICNMANNRKNGQLPTDAQINEIKEYIADNMHYMTSSFLSCIEDIALTSGLFTTAYASREKNEELLLQRAHTKIIFTKRQATKLFWCYLNSGDDNAATSMNHRVFLFSRPVVSKHICNLCNILGLIPNQPSKHLQKSEQAAFADYVKGRSIAIIGPSSSGVDYNEEIKNNFDIIIRMRYRGQETLPEAQRELIPHVTYYCRETSKEILNPERNIGYLTDLDFAVFKRTYGKYYEEAYKKATSYTKTRGAFINNTFLFSSPSVSNMLQQILYDLSLFEPARIKVFNANCFLSHTIHDKGYSVAKEGTALTAPLWCMFAVHNLMCNYNYTMNLYRRGLIEADDYLSEILELGTEEYMRKFQQQENQYDYDGIRF